MEYASVYLYKLVPYEIYLKIAEFEWPTKKWHIKHTLDNYTIRNKFILSRQISKVPRDEIHLDYSIKWDKIIRHNQLMLIKAD
jgi:hypothetical protein